ncbi:unnamed protein product, partial [Discosporangium mesarthrocarpum]
SNIVESSEISTRQQIRRGGRHKMEDSEIANPDIADQQKKGEKVLGDLEVPKGSSPVDATGDTPTSPAADSKVSCPLPVIEYAPSSSSTERSGLDGRTADEEKQDEKLSACPQISECNKKDRVEEPSRENAEASRDDTEAVKNIDASSLVKQEKNIEISKGAGTESTEGRAGAKSKKKAVKERTPRQICLEEGCSKSPSFGMPGGRAEYCSVHKAPGMMNVRVTPKCETPDCMKTAKLGYRGCKPQFCHEHSLEGMVTVRANTQGPRPKGSSDLPPTRERRKGGASTG